MRYFASRALRLPSVGPWAFQGARPGETSELFDAEDGYYLARLDSLTPGGTLSLDQAKNDIRAYLLRQKKIDALLPQAQNFAKVAAASSLESAAKLMNLQVVSTKPFTRVTGVPELAQAPEAVGAAFSLPLHTVSEPIKSTGAVVVERVDNRFSASRAAFEAQKDVLRQQAVQQRMIGEQVHAGRQRGQGHGKERREPGLEAARAVLRIVLLGFAQ